MADEVATDGAGDEGAGSTPDPIEPVDIDAVAGSPPESVEAETSGSTPAGTPSTEVATEPEEFRNALGKHKGDKAAFGRHYWQTQKDNARLAQERGDLEAKLKELEAGQPRTPAQRAEPEPVDVAPELKDLETYLGSLEEEQKALPTLQAQRLGKVSQIHQELVKLGVRLEMSDEMDKDGWEQKIRLAELHKSEAERAFAAGRERDRSLGLEIRRAQRERNGMQLQIESERERQEQVVQDAKKFKESFPAQVDSHITQAFDGLKVPEEGRQPVWEATQEALIAKYGRMKGIPAAEVDHEALAKATTAEVVKRFDAYARAKYVQASKDKLKVSRPAGTPPLRSATPEPKRALLPYEIDDVDPKLKAARERAAARGWT